MSVEVVVSDGVGRLALNRPAVINSLNLEMIRSLSDALDRFAADDAVESVELCGLGPRGLCAGADVKELREWVSAGRDTVEFFTTEYRLNLRILTYPKPFTAHLHGITMGGGMGVSIHASKRVAAADTVLAMPETKIGFFPDVLMNWHLAQLPHEIGAHLVMTGDSFNVADALWLGLVNDCIGTPPAPTLPNQAGWIAECYAGDDAATIVQRLEQHSDPQARATAAALRQRCPFSVAVSLKAIRRARANHTLVRQLSEETTLARNLTLRPDFSEGVRAVLVDRDNTPTWQHATIEDVTREEIHAAFEPDFSSR